MRCTVAEGILWRKKRTGTPSERHGRRHNSEQRLHSLCDMPLNGGTSKGNSQPRCASRVRLEEHTSSRRSLVSAVNDHEVDGGAAVNRGQLEKVVTTKKSLG